MNNSRLSYCIAQFPFGPSLHTAKILLQSPFNAAKPCVGEDESCEGDWSDQNAKGTLFQWMVIIFLYYLLPLQPLCFEACEVVAVSTITEPLGQHSLCPAPLPENGTPQCNSPQALKIALNFPSLCMCSLELQPCWMS